MIWSKIIRLLSQMFSYLKQKITRKVIFLIGGVFVGLVVIALLLAPTVIRYSIDKKIRQIESDKQIKIELNGLQLNGFTGVSVESLYIIPMANDTLFTMKKLDAKLSFWQMLLLRADLKSVSIEEIALRFVKKKDYCNYSFLFKSKQNSDTTVSNTIDYSSRVSSLLNFVFRLLPSDLAIQRLSFASQNYDLKTIISAQNISVADHAIKTTLKVDDNTQHQMWLVEALLDKDNYKLFGKISTTDGKKATLPYIHQVYNTRVAFNELSFNFLFNEEGNKVALDGRAAFSGLEVNHPRLSPEDIQLGSGAFDYKLHIGRDFAELDSTSEITFNRLSFHPYVYAQRSDKWHLILAVDKHDFSAEDLFQSLPKGLFHSLSDVRVRGNLDYHFLLDVDLNNPDKLRLESSLRKVGFAITNYGELTKMNSPFLYTAYENDHPVRTFEVGAGNPSFRPLESVSVLLRQAVLQSEDGQFFFHRGFRLDALREALIHDIKVKRFARGGSTISMQLVKNVFLNRHKNIARKLEEALLVWLIEENRITPKERMFEVYLNIAEWGPMIYGIGEASHFYFDKEPADLNLNEAIFLASIIPSPKRFSSSFDETGRLKQNRYWHFNRIAERLFRTGFISEEERATFVPEVILSGVAKNRIATAASDSVATTIENELPLN